MKTQLPEKLENPDPYFGFPSFKLGQTLNQLITYLEEAEAAYEETLNGYSKHHRETQPENTVPTDVEEETAIEKRALIKGRLIDGDTWPFVQQLTLEEYKQFRKAMTEAHTAGAASRDAELREEIVQSITNMANGPFANAIYSWTPTNYIKHIRSLTPSTTEKTEADVTNTDKTEKIKAGAKDFAERFEGVMEELSGG